MCDALAPRAIALFRAITKISVRVIDLFKKRCNIYYYQYCEALPTVPQQYKTQLNV
jgi:hypothetical protein